ncbi:hypothetical protein N9064_00530 [bacterium]|nr:hypothetical protein [bacterium]
MKHNYKKGGEVKIGGVWYVITYIGDTFLRTSHGAVDFSAPWLGEYREPPVEEFEFIEKVETTDYLVGICLEVEDLRKHINNKLNKKFPNFGSGKGFDDFLKDFRVKHEYINNIFGISCMKEAYQAGQESVQGQTKELKVWTKGEDEPENRSNVKVLLWNCDEWESGFYLSDLENGDNFIYCPDLPKGDS